MHDIFKKNYNLIIKNFISMCLRKEQHYPSHIAVLYRFRVKLCRTEKQPRTKIKRLKETMLFFFFYQFLRAESSGNRLYRDFEALCMKFPIVQR